MLRLSRVLAVQLQQCRRSVLACRLWPWGAVWQSRALGRHRGLSPQRIGCGWPVPEGIEVRARGAVTWVAAAGGVGVGEAAAARSKGRHCRVVCVAEVRERLLLE